MAYVIGNPKTKKKLREMVEEGTAQLNLLTPFTPVLNGIEYVEGPHYPQPHRWYAQVEVKDGLIVKVLK